MKRTWRRRPRRRGAPPCVGCGRAADQARAELAAPRTPSEADLPSHDAVPVRVGSLLSAVQDAQLVLLDPATGRFHVLSTSAALAYTSVDGRTDVAGIAEAIVADTDADRAAVIEGVRLALGSLAVEGLVRFASAGPDGAALVATDATADLDAEADARAARWDAARRRRLDRADWATRFGPLALGRAVGFVRVHDDRVTAELAPRLESLPAAPEHAPIDGVISVVGDADCGPYRVYLDGELVARTTSTALAATVAASTVNRIAAAAPADALRFHAGVVAQDDRAVLVTGASGHGKSSLTTALVQHGWGYLSDEVGVVDHDTDLVTPFPKWIDLSRSALALLGIDHADGEDSAGFDVPVLPTRVGHVHVGPARVAALVVLDPTPRSDAPDDSGERLESLTGIDALVELLPQVFPGSWDHPNALQALLDLADRIAVVRLHRAPPTAMVAAIQRLLDGERNATPGSPS